MAPTQAYRHYLIFLNHRRPKEACSDWQVLQREKSEIGNTYMGGA